MMQNDPFSYRRIFHFSLSYGAVVLALLSYEPLARLGSEPVTVDRVREAGASIGALLPVGMAVAAVVAGVVRKLLFRFGGVNRNSLWAVFVVGTFWHLPFTILVAYSAARHEAGAWWLPLWFTAVGAVASVALVWMLRYLVPCRTKD